MAVVEQYVRGVTYILGNCLCWNSIVVSSRNNTKTQSMEFDKWIGILSFVAFFGISSYGNAYPVFDAEDDDLFLNEENEPFHKRDIKAPVFYSEPSLSVPDDDSIVDMLKRSGFQLSEGYQRFPRLKSRLIIPFYSYGKNQGYYRPKPRLPGGPPAYFGYNPWNIESFKYGSSVFPKGGYRY